MCLFSSKLQRTAQTSSLVSVKWPCVYAVVVNNAKEKQNTNPNSLSPGNQTFALWQICAYNKSLKFSIFTPVLTNCY